MRRTEQPDYDAIRTRILNGEDAQIILTRRMFEKAGDLTTKAAAEIRFRTESGRWPRTEDLIIVVNLKNGPDDSANVLGSVARWLEAGRQDEAEIESGGVTVVDAFEIITDPKAAE